MFGMHVFRFLFILFSFSVRADSFIFSTSEIAEIVRSVKIRSGNGCVFYVELWDQRLRGEFRKSKKIEPITELFSELAFLHLMVVVTCSHRSVRVL